MIYRVYLETVSDGDKIGWGFMFYNHQDFCVYKRCGNAVGKSEKEVILETAEVALAYFSNFMRKRYYDEHFATILDEDYITLFTSLPEIEETADKINDACAIGFIGEDKPLWEALLPYLTRSSMSFKTSADKRFIDASAELAKKGLTK